MITYGNGWSWCLFSLFAHEDQWIRWTNRAMSEQIEHWLRKWAAQKLICERMWNDRYQVDVLFVINDKFEQLFEQIMLLSVLDIRKRFKLLTTSCHPRKKKAYANIGTNWINKTIKITYSFSQIIYRLLKIDWQNYQFHTFMKSSIKLL